MKKLSSAAFLKRVKDTIKQYDMLEPGDRVLVAVSGGPDSVCLLEAIFALRNKLDINITVANMDHGMRPRKESKKDSDFVKALAGELSLKYVHKKIDLKKQDKGKVSPEEKARHKRYAFLKHAAEKYGCGVIATGHTMDDQAETVIMRFVTGSSLRGIAGIPAVRYDARIKIIRPLILTGKKDIIDHLDAVGRGYCEDLTNRDTKLFRNSVRHEIIPFLEKYNPRLRRSMVNLCDSVREDLSYIDDEKKNIKRIKKGGTGAREKIEVKDLILQPKALRKEIFKELFTRAGGNVKKLTYRHWKEMDVLLRTAGSVRSLDLPGDIRVTRGRFEVHFAKRRR